MKELAFLDTNILVHADDLGAGRKRDIARDLLQEHLRGGTGVISTQVLQEYFVIATRKLGVSPESARRKVELLSSLHVVPVGIPLILESIDLHRLRGFSFWDSLVLAAASAAGCREILTEDLQDGEIVAGARVRNPFREPDE